MTKRRRKMLACKFCGALVGVRCEHCRKFGIVSQPDGVRYCRRCGKCQTKRSPKRERPEP